MRDTEVLGRFIDDSIKLQISMLINLQSISRESIELAMGLYNVSEMDAEAVRDADTISLQNIGQFNTIFSCGAVPRNSLKTLIESQNANSKSPTLAQITVVSLK